MAYVTGERREALRREVARRYRRGQSVRLIAIDLGYSYAGMHALLKQAGVEFRERGSRLELEDCGQQW